VEVPFVAVGRWLGLWAGVVLLSGCASAWQSSQLLANPPHTLPVVSELHETPFFPQEKYQCGPAALATVLNRYQHKVTPEALVPLVYLPARGGSLQVELVATARRFGMLPYPLAPRLEDLLREVAAGHPVLVLQNLAFDWLPQWHYAVLVGYDLQQGEVVLRSGTTRRWQSALSTFEKTWQRGNYWARVIVPAGQIPVTAKPAPYLKTVHDLEKTAQLEAALRAYRAATVKWPSRSEVWFTFGNMAFQMQHYDDALNAFKQVVALIPQDARGWNNLAYSLRLQGCVKQARQAIACAVRLAPQDANLQDSYQVIYTDEALSPSVQNLSNHITALCEIIICPEAE